MFSDPGFEGMIAVLEKGEYPIPESWGFTSPFVGSLRPLKMVCLFMCVSYNKFGLYIHSLIFAILVKRFYGRESWLYIRFC